MRNDTITVKEPPKKEEVERFWRNIYEDEKIHNNEAVWIQETINDRKTQSINLMEFPPISEREIKGILRKLSNWKAPGPDRVANVWIKKITSLVDPLTKCINKLIIEEENMPEWLTTGDTYLIPKNEETKNPEKYRPITCLPTIYKILTSILSSRIYEHIEQHDIINEEQKGCIRNCLGTKDQLLINKMILENCRHHQKNLSMTWIDYKKAYDSVPHSWIRRVLQIYKINDKIVSFVSNSMQKWMTNLNLHHEKGTINIRDVQIKRGIFQGDSLSPLLFILALNPLSSMINKLQNGYRINARTDKTVKQITHLFYMDDLKLFASNKRESTRQMEVVKEFSLDIHMEFGLEKCAFLALRKGRKVDSENIIVDQTIIKQLEQDSTYKYLGIEESEKIEHKLMKEKITKEYLKRVKLILKSELYARNKVEAIMSLAIPVFAYSIGTIDWYQEELNQLDIKTRKMLNAHRMIYKNQFLSRMYVDRSEGGLGLTEMDNIYKKEICGLALHLEHSTNKFIQWVYQHEQNKAPATSITKKKTDYLAIYNISTDFDQSWADKTMKEKIKYIKNKFDCGKRQGHINQWGQQVFGKEYREMLLTEYVDKVHSVEILQKGTLRSEEERVLVAAQDITIRTRWYRKHIERKNISDLCRLCHQYSESVSHLLSGCEILLGKHYYTDRHNMICKNIHYKLSKKYKLPIDASNYYKHNPPEIVENELARVLYDCNIPTDVHVAHNKPDIVVKDKRENKCYIIEVGVPFDNNIAAYEREKEIKYQRLKNEIRRMWNVTDVYIIPIIVGSMGIVKKSLNEHLQKLPIKITIYELSIAVIKKSIAILRMAMGCN